MTKISSNVNAHCSISIEYSIKEHRDKLPSHILGMFPNHQKAKEYYTSRLALLECLQTTLETDQEHDVEQLVIVNNHYLQKYPHLAVSLSHSKNLGAAVVGDRFKCTSVGIDIEIASRSFNRGTTKFFINQLDSEEHKKNILATWSSKEAAFKALSPIVNNNFDRRPLLLKDIWLQKNEFGLGGSIAPWGEFICSIEKHHGQEIILSLALLKPSANIGIDKKDKS